MLCGDSLHGSLDGLNTRCIAGSYIHVKVGIIGYNIGALTAVDDAYAERRTGNGAVKRLHLLNLVGEFKNGVAPALRLNSSVRRNSAHLDAILSGTTARRTNRAVTC